MPDFGGIFGKLFHYKSRAQQLEDLQRALIRGMQRLKYEPDETLIVEKVLPELAELLTKNVRAELVSEKINPKDNYYTNHPFKLDRRAASEDLKSAILSINQTLFRKEYNHVFNSIYITKVSLSGKGPDGSGGDAALEREARVQEMGKYVDMVMNNPTVNPQILADLQITDDDLKMFSEKH